MDDLDNLLLAAPATNGRNGNRNGHATSSMPTPAHDEFASTEAVSRVRQAISTLPENYREAVILCELQEMTYDEAALALGCPVGTVRSRLHRGRALLLETSRGAAGSPPFGGGGIMQEVRSMDCAQFEELLHDLDRPGTEAFARREAALTHAESCSRCAILVMQSESLDIALQALAKRESGRLASPHVAATLMEQFQRHKFASLSRRVKRRVAALAAAAAVLLAVGFWLHFSQSQISPTAINEQPAAPSPAPVTASANSAQPAAPPAAVSRPAAPTGPSANIQRASLQLESQNDAAFVRLPYSDDSGSLDNDAVVRVVLTPATLASFGLPVSGLGSGESVQADLAVSPDGMPQAVRLVSGTSSDQEF